MSADVVPPPVRCGSPRFLARWWPPVTPRIPVTLGAPPGAAPAYAQAAYTNELNLLAAATEGERNDTLNRAAFNLAQLVAAGHLPWQETWQGLHDLAVLVGLTEAETRATLRSAFGAGEKHPRVVPDPSLLDAPPVTVLDWPVGHPDAAAATVPLAEAAEGLGIGERFPVLDWQALWDDEEQEEWIVQPLIPARRLVALFSPPKIGKSLLMLELAVAVSRGEPVLGVTLDRPRRVLYVDFENDPRGDIRARLQAMGRGPDDLKDLFYLSFPRLPYLDTAVGGLTLLAVVEHYAVEVVIIDTISRAVGGEENDNNTWLSFYRHTGVALKARGVACVRLDHTGKDESKGMRGGSAKYGDVDVVWSMRKIGDQPAAFHLECVANRLPISETSLNIIRDTDPGTGKLRHRVKPGFMRDAIEEEARRVMAELDDLDAPPLEGFPAAWDRVGAGEIQCTAAVLKEALRLRKKRTEHPVAPPEQARLELYVIKDPRTAPRTALEDES